MRIDTLELKQFRNYQRLKLSPLARINIFQGDNGTGKTNILEALHLLATTKSFRKAKDNELINWQNKSYYFAKGIASNKNESQFSLSLGFKDNKKHFSYNHNKITKAKDFFGQIVTVLFSPRDLDLLIGPPTERRRFLDALFAKSITQGPQNENYLTTLTNFNRALQQRNSLLREGINSNTQEESLIVYSKIFSKYGVELFKLRHRVWQSFSRIIQDVLASFKEEMPRVEIEYQSLLYSLDQGKDSLETDFFQFLSNHIEKEKRFKTTLYGPQRDDLDIMINGHKAAKYASQGQKRLITIALRLAEYHLIKEQRQEEPIFLVDDIFFELDQNNQEWLIQFLALANQAFITVTRTQSLKPLLDKYFGDYNLYHVTYGQVKLDSNV